MDRPSQESEARRREYAESLNRKVRESKERREREPLPPFGSPTESEARAQAERDQLVARQVREWKEQKERKRRQKVLRRTKAATEASRSSYPLYLRFGEPPKTGRSNTYRREVLALAEAEGAPAGLTIPDALLEEGVSVFRARREEDGSYVVDVSADVQHATLFALLADAGRPAYLLDGREVGFGWVGEPVLSDVRILERLPNRGPDGAPLVRSSGHFGSLVGLFAIPRRLGAALSGRKPDITSSGLQAVLLPHHTEKARRAGLHGPRHALRVAQKAVSLCSETAGADPHVAVLFGLLHDSQRLSDGPDPEHGRRAAEKVPELLHRSLFDATEEQAALLVKAIAEHADGGVSSDPTIGVCWDADRLDLGRCGIKPDPAYLSTGAARKQATGK